MNAVAYVKNIDTQVRVSVNNFRNIWYIHIREYRLDGDTGNWFPTPKGYAMSAEGLDSVIELLQDASQFLTEKFYENHFQMKFDFME